MYQVKWLRVRKGRTMINPEVNYKASDVINDVVFPIVIYPSRKKPAVPIVYHWGDIVE